MSGLNGISGVNAIVTVALVILLTTTEPWTIQYVATLTGIGIWAWLGYEHLDLLTKRIFTKKEWMMTTGDWKDEG